MVVKSVRLDGRNVLAADYVKGKLKDFFHYPPFSPLHERLEYLHSRTFPRQELANLLIEMNEKWGASPRTFERIETFKRESAVFVIGGQQAGLLAGPLYTIHKIVSIIKFARMQEERLNVPVIPLFWIAGEDHDYDEINHIYNIVDNKLVKRKIGQEEWKKRSVSHIPIDQTALEAWIKQVFNDLLETEHTRKLATEIFRHARASETFVDFFARFIHGLFKNHGIVLIDSANAKLRQLESTWFEKLIIRQQDVAEAVYETAQKLHQAGYSVQVDVEKDDGNLFYHDEAQERILLVRKNDLWIGKNDEVELTTADLVHLARNEPERLSNNVITRPLMQEAMLPTLTFIAGDAEIGYWALLKNAFKALDETLTMPPIVPRLSVTLINERIDKLLKERSLHDQYIVNYGCKMLKMNWLASQKNPPVHLIFEEAKRNMEDLHEPLQQLAKSIGPDLYGEAKRNLANILEELDYLKQKTLQHLEHKYSFELEQFQEINLALRPKDTLQERVLNVVSIINECGDAFLNDLIELDLPFEEDHHIVYLHKLHENV